ncbi:hypothetical protein DFH08DRAFT_797282 [Mycena albidolilacea]|uniref:Uncharacterized protein n=1 Tax=Mycena albidolilacea TaxID=1033008 RepID=A0AAD7F499_9AGAR|nr:hypothetical protein DFH08DRAFT_797282 [Mycena albidolilacea]
MSDDSRLVPYLDAGALTLMPASPLHPPWPERTAASSHASTSKLAARQVIADQSAVDAAKKLCENTGNEVLSCFPTASTVIAQHEWATFVWNSNNPDFLQTERVDIYLFHGDSLEQILAIPNQVNPRGQAGSVSRQVNDLWWGTRGVDWGGSNISYPFYWLIARHGESLDDGTLKPQATFSAVQTTFADSVLATRSPSSSSSVPTATLTPSASSSSSGVFVTTTISQFSTITSTSPGHGIQSNEGDAAFPHWAIILLVLGIVAVVAICGLMLFGILYLRRRDKRDQYPDAVRSSSPGPEMEEAVDEAGPVVAAAGAGAGAGGLAGRDTARSGAPHGDERNTTSPEPRPFSGSDAAIMASAFRAELRQPSGRHDEDEDEDGDGDGDDDGDGGRGGDGATLTRGAQTDAERERETLLRRELEGADIRSVDSMRGVRVESSSEGHGRGSPRVSV